jgi:hypothetical protein
MGYENESDLEDAALVRIGVEWLSQYVRFLRRAPEVVAKLAADVSSFEMVPVPRNLLDQLAVSGLVGSARLASPIDLRIVEGLRTAAADAGANRQGEGPSSSGDPMGAAGAFALAIERGSLPDIADLISSRFLDDDGRSPDDILTSIKRLTDGTTSRRLRVLNACETRRSAREAAVVLSVAWDAQSLEGASPAISESLSLEVLLELNGDERWKIASVRSS